jgi:hydrogenase nickel incorporation protein HypB
MCDSCGCSDHSVAEVRTTEEHVHVLRDLLAENKHQALHNRLHLDQHGVVAVNLMSAPGAGKTALLEATIAELAGQYRIGIIVGDLATENDARRLRRHGVDAVQIETGQVCHLDSAMVHRALHDLPLDELDFLFIENVGNLVCPACFDLGQHHNVVLLSVTEGADKPAKYPVMFRVADRVVLTKLDLLPYVGDFQPEAAIAALRGLANTAPVQALSARSGEGLDVWLTWLTTIRKSRPMYIQVSS